ncbi:MAG: hypothetical protein WA159_20575 [Variovorax sp.]
MFYALLRTALPLCLATALAACGGGGSDSDATAPTTNTPPTAPTTASTTMDASGGTLVGPGGVTIVVPAGALSAATKITITESSAGAPASLPQGSSLAVAQSKVYELTPHDVTFAQPVTIRIPIDTTKGTPRVYVSDLTTGWYPQTSTAGSGYVEIQRTGFSWIYTVIPVDDHASSEDGLLLLASFAALDIESASSMKLPGADGSAHGALDDVKYSPTVVQMETFQGQAASASFKAFTEYVSGASYPHCQASQMALDILAGGIWVNVGQFAAASKTQQTFPGFISTSRDTSLFNVSFTPTLLGTFDLRVRTVCDNAADMKAIDPRLADATWKIRMKVSPSYAVGGTVGGLPTGGSVQVALNGGTAQTVSANGTFTLSTRLGNGASYAITTSDATAGYTCTLAHGSGTIAEADVTNVGVTCVPTPYSLSGNVTGLPQGASVTLLLNGADGRTVSNPSGDDFDFLPFTLATLVVPGQNYEVTVGTVSPSGYACSVNGGTGTMPANAVDGIVVNCTPAGPFTLGGTASGLDAGGPYPSMVLMLNGDSSNTTTVPLTGNGAYSLGSVAGGASYYVSVDVTGTGYDCFAVNRSGGATANVSNIDVSCR